MPITNKLRRGLDRKVWQAMTPCPTTNAAGMFIMTNPTGFGREALYVCSTSTIYLYDHEEDAWVQLPASGIAGAFGAGACGAFHKNGPTGTAVSGSTATSLKTNLTIPRSIAGYTVRITGGPGAGEERTITHNTKGANSVLSFDTPFSVPLTTASTYLLLTGRFWFFCPGTSAVGLRYWDRALSAWSGSMSVTGLPTSFGTEGRLVATYGGRTDLATGTATGGSTTTLVNSAKSWKVGQFKNMQVRITAGTGAGQTKLITGNTATALTVEGTWTAPTAGSEYVIEGCDDFLYLFGNNAVTLYRYRISTNTWETLAPTTARGGAMGAGGGANWVARVSDPEWNNESDLLNGRYIYSFRGAGANTLDRYNIPENKWENAITYGNQGTTFTTGSSYDLDGDCIYCSKEGTGRIHRFDIAKNLMEATATLMVPNGTATVGDKMWVWRFAPDGPEGDSIPFVYYLQHTLTSLFRTMLF